MMGSATAMLMGTAPAKAIPAASGDAPESQQGSGFLAALDAAVPAGSADADGAAVTAVQADEAVPEEATVVDMAAILAAMLQTSVPIEDTGGTSESAVGDAVPTGAASLLTTGAGKAAELTNLRAAAANLASAAAEADAAATNPVAGQAIAATTNPLDDKSAKPGAQTGLRQLLQMLAPQASASAANAGNTNSADSVAQAPATYAAPAAVIRRAVDVVTALPVNKGAQASEPATQPSTVTLDSGLAAANLAAPHATRAAAAGPEQTLQAPVGTPRWADELGSRLVLMSLRGQHEGSLNLTPEHLGPLEVRVSVNQNTANVWFGSQHADTRAALAEALPRLRELLAGAGLTLGQAGVSEQAPRQSSRENEVARIAAARASAAVEGLDAATLPGTRRIALGLVDTYV